MGSNHERVRSLFCNSCVCVHSEPKGVAFPIRSSSVSVGMEMMFCAEGCTAVIDTGSSYITGPASSVSVLMRTIGAQQDESGVRFYTRSMLSRICLVKHSLASSSSLISLSLLFVSTKSTVTPSRRCPGSLSTWVARSTHSLTRIISYG